MVMLRMVTCGELMVDDVVRRRMLLWRFCFCFWVAGLLSVVTEGVPSDGVEAGAGCAGALPAAAAASCMIHEKT